MRISIPPWKAREYERANRLAVRDAVFNGFTPSVTESAVGWRRVLSGDCERPVAVVHYCNAGWGMRSRRWGGQKAVWYPHIDGGDELGWNVPDQRWIDQPLEKDFVQISHFRCRRCLPCLNRRADDWSGRAGAEIAASKRTWVVTLTYAPKTFEAWAFAELDPERAAGDELTRFLKRLRKLYPFRYLAALEYGETGGRIHHHLLIHSDTNLRRRDIAAAWQRKGFDHCRLVDLSSAYAKAKAAQYVAKYITKSLTTRLRASNHYGMEV